MIALTKFSKGGGIHIKKKNRGKFTASAKKAGHSVQEHARAVLNNPNASATQKKRANFARNAAKWKKADGGPIDPTPNDGKFDLGRLRRIGSMEGWKTSVNPDGTLKLQAENEFSNMVRGADSRAVDVYKGVVPADQRDLMRHTRQTAGQFLQRTPEIQSVDIGEINWPLTGMSNPTGASLQNDVIGFNFKPRPQKMQDKVTDIDLGSAALSAPVKRKGLPNVLYSPDSYGKFGKNKTAAYIEALRRQKGDISKHNSYADVVNLFKSNYKPKT